MMRHRRDTLDSTLRQQKAHAPDGRPTWSPTAASICLGAIVSLVSGMSLGAETAEKQPSKPAPPESVLTEPLDLRRLDPKYDVWLDPKRKLVVVDGEVAIREGLLEMFACPKGTKEHESIVAVNSNAAVVHAGLLAAGAVPGKPVRFQPTYVPASGTTVDIYVLWIDAQGKRQQVRAQQWIKEARTGKELEQSWVFGGSGFSTDEQTGKRYYYGDGGDFICISNFPSATLDLPIKSSDSNTELVFTPFTERIPPRGTKVRLVLAPQLTKKKPDEPAVPAKAKP